MNVENDYLIKGENSFAKFVKEVAKYFMWSKIGSDLHI